MSVPRLQDKLNDSQTEVVVALLTVLGELALDSKPCRLER